MFKHVLHEHSGDIKRKVLRIWRTSSNSSSKNPCLTFEWIGFATEVRCRTLRTTTTTGPSPEQWNQAAWRVWSWSHPDPRAEATASSPRFKDWLRQMRTYSSRFRPPACSHCSLQSRRIPSWKNLTQDRVLQLARGPPTTWQWLRRARRLRRPGGAAKQATSRLRSSKLRTALRPTF